MWFYQESWQIQIKRVFDGEPAGILPELNVYMEVSEAINSIPENPTFQGFGSPVRFYGRLQLMRM